MKLRLALIGNQNSGKTTLFNQLTGSKQHVGNFPGVTVEKKEGPIRKRKDVTVVDLPGIYSLSPYTPEEVLTRDFLLKDKPDGIINIVDATNIERNLYLTLQLTELNIPMVLALNMMDEVKTNGIFIDIKKIQAGIGVPVVPISASKNDGISELVDKAIEVCQKGRRPQRQDFCEGEVHKVIHSVAHIIEDHAKDAGIPARFAATKLIEGDQPMMRALALHRNEVDIIEWMVKDMESELGTYRDAALADMRYAYIEKLCADAVVKKQEETKEMLRSIKIDNVLTHKFFAIPIFLLLMMLVFYLTFGAIGAWLSDMFSAGLDLLFEAADTLLTDLQVSPALHSLIVDGIFAGVGSVLSFLPTILVLFFFLSMLEDSGYMARVAFVMDRLLRRIGLSGRSFVPMLLGFGCSVPAIMATRTLPSERDRKMTILLVPFMSCSAKLPIYAVFTAAFFERNQALVMTALYIMGIAVGILSALFLKNTYFKGKPVPFLMELPAYRFPAPKSVILHMWEKAKDFLARAFTVIFFATIIIWFLQSFDFRFIMVSDSSDSMLAFLGKLISPVFAPLGFGDWRAATALVTGLTAKEAVVSTFAILTGASEAASLAPVLGQIFTPLTAFSFLTFTLLYMPCVAAMAAVKRELGGMKKAALAMAYQTATAWVVTFVLYQTGRLVIGI